MTVFACKDAFISLGIEGVQPSASHIARDCPICTKPLAVHHNDASPRSRLHGYHDAVRIISCGHMHGRDCLTAWLNVGNACPTCNRILFELSGDPITQQDFNNIIYRLGPQYGEARVNIALVSMMQKREQENVTLRRAHEREVTRQTMKDAEVFDEGFMLSDGDLLDSEGEINFGEDGDDDENREYIEEEDDEQDEEDEKKHDYAN